MKRKNRTETQQNSGLSRGQNTPNPHDTSKHYHTLTLDQGKIQNHSL